MSLETAMAMKKGYRAHGTILGKFLSAVCIGVLLGLFVTFGAILAYSGEMSLSESEGMS
jgi:hypothetical protein